MDDYVRIVLKNEVEARKYEWLLKERNIPYYIQSYHDSALDGLYQNTNGWGRIEVSEEYCEQLAEVDKIFEEMKVNDDEYNASEILETQDTTEEEEITISDEEINTFDENTAETKKGMPLIFMIGLILVAALIVIGVIITMNPHE